MINHDRAFKLLLSTFFFEFIELFFPDLERYIDRNSIVQQDKEIFSDLTEGETHEADLLFRSKYKSSDSYFLVHVETQAQRQPDFPRRMFSYFSRLHLKYGLQIYPIVVFSFDKPEIRQPSSYEIKFPDLDVLKFRFQTVQLNLLEWQDFADRMNPLAAALMAKMRIPPEERWLVELKSIELLAKLDVPPAHAKLISEFFDTYLKPTASEKAKINVELAKMNPEQQERIMEIIETSWSREAREQGRLIGMASLLTRQLIKRLGKLDDSVLNRIQALSDSQLEELGLDMLDFVSVAELLKWLEAHGQNEQ